MRGIKCHANRLESLFERDTFRPVVVEESAIRIEQEPPVLPHQSLVSDFTRPSCKVQGDYFAEAALRGRMPAVGRFQIATTPIFD